MKKHQNIFLKASKRLHCSNFQTKKFTKNSHFNQKLNAIIHFCPAYIPRHFCAINLAIAIFQHLILNYMEPFQYWAMKYFAIILIKIILKAAQN